MQSFPLAYTTHSDLTEAVADISRQLGDTAQATLAFIYVTDAHAARFKQLVDALRQQTGVSHWVGSVGQGICCTRHEFYEEAAVVVMLADIPEQSFTVFSEPGQLHHDTAAESVRLAVVHGDPRNGQLPGLIAHLPEQIGNGYPVGGLTSAGQYFYQLADGICEGQLSGVVFEPEVQVVSALSQGCSPIGPSHTITECEGHVVHSIDNRPALEVMNEDIGEVLARDIKRAAGYIFAGFPVTGSDTGDYLVRNLVGVDPKRNYIAIAEYLKPDMRLMFCRRDGQTAVADLERMLESIKQRLPGPVRGGLYFSCLGRGRYLFGEDSRELKLIADHLGDIPLVGFYANGEIAGQRLYGYTGVLTLFV